MRELALFAGAGGGLLGSHLLGWRTRCAVEIDAYARSVLFARQLDGALERFPLWDDVRTFDGRPWRGTIDVVSGGFPCQDVSAAGRGAGLAGSRSGLWYEMQRIIGEVRPRFVFAENSPNLRTRGLGTVVKGLAGLGYDARWCVLGARHVGAPHKRDRMWVLAADTEREGVRLQPGRFCGEIREETPKPIDHGQGRILADPTEARFMDGSEPEQSETESPRLDVGSGTAIGAGSGRSPWEAEPGLGRVADGVADRVDRLKSIGNGQVPAVVALAWRTLSAGLV
jgi:DNA (cytosine-5)-methyltransferase 1